MPLLRFAIPALLLNAVLTAAAPAQDDNPLVAQVRDQVADPAKPFIMFVHIDTKPGMGPDLEAAFAPATAATLKEKGCLAYKLSRSAKSPETYVLYEHWASLDDLKAHLQSSHIAELLPKLGSLSASPATIDIHLPAAQ